MEPWILTAHGNHFNFFDWTNNVVDVEEIASSLSKTCRFTGHTRQFYSVAEHSVYVSRLVPEDQRLPALLHDAAEAFLGDVSSPLKALLPDYKAIEAMVEKELFKRLGMPEKLTPEIKQADLRVCAAEKRDLMVDKHNYHWAILDTVEPMEHVIKYPMSDGHAFEFFMSVYEELS